MKPGFRNGNFWFLLFAGTLLILNNCSSRKNRSDSPVFTLEDEGGQAWYLPVDGRLQNGIQYPLISYIPYSANPDLFAGTGYERKGYCIISIEGDGTWFTEAITGKSFCGLFAHRNPLRSDAMQADLYFPGELGSRYARVVHRVDSRNVIVDFEYNGGNTQSPQILLMGKGYFFYNNSTAWAAMAGKISKEAEAVELRLDAFGIDQRIQKVYVIPEYDTWNLKGDLKIWSGVDVLPALKIGYEDYYGHEQFSGNNAIRQAPFLFNLPGQEFDHNLLVCARIYPPHRTVLEAETFRRTLITGRKAGGITALIGARQLDEERAIQSGTGINGETFISWSFSATSGGGRLSSPSEGVLQKVSEFGYVLCKDYEQKAAFFTQMNGHGGHYLVVEDADLYFHPQETVNPASQGLSVYLERKSPYSTFGKEIQDHARYYLPYTLSVSEAGNFFKVFALGGSNRLNIIAIEGKESVLSFTMNAQGVRSDNPGQLMGYWEFCYVPKKDRFDWDWSRSEPCIPGRTSEEMILIEEIPERGKKYTISRDYKVRENYQELADQRNARLGTVNTQGKRASRDPEPGTMYSNVIRTAVCWSTVLQKYGIDINPEKDIPANGKPLALQPGDQFRIPAYAGSTHNPQTVYEVVRKDRGMFPSNPAEFVCIRNRKDWKYDRTNFQSYRYFWCELDKDLPESLGLSFEIEVLNSMAEELLDGKARRAWQTYKGVDRMAPASKGRPNDRGDAGKTGFYNKKMAFDDPYWQHGEAMGHLCYSQVELTEWYRNVNWNHGFYRQNSNDGRGFEKFSISSEKGEKMRVSPLACYSQGKTFINCTGGPLGQYSSGLDDFYIIDQILKFKGQKQDYRILLRIYNSPDVRYVDVTDAEKYVEIHETDLHAPDMPKICRELLQSLPGID